MHSTSVVSRTPSVTYSPSLMPDPPRSTANTVMRAGRSSRMASVASHRDPELPCRYITHGSGSSPLTSGS